MKILDDNEYAGFKPGAALNPVVAMSEYEYLMTVPDAITKNIEKWMAVVGNKIVAVGDSPKEVLAKARALHPGVEPFIARFPKEKAMLL